MSHQKSRNQTQPKKKAPRMWLAADDPVDS
jgi:hypothetical protein